MEKTINKVNKREQSFDVETDYPALFVGAEVVNSSSDDCDVVFKFMVSNNYGFKKIFTKTTSGIFTKHKLSFLYTCLHLFPESEFDDMREDFEEYLQSLDLNDAIGTKMIMNVIDSKNSPRIEYLYLYEEYECPNEIDYDKVFANWTYDMDKVPDNINVHLRDLACKEYVYGEPVYNTEPENKDPLFSDIEEPDIDFDFDI